MKEKLKNKRGRIWSFFLIILISSAFFAVNGNAVTINVVDPDGTPQVMTTSPSGRYSSYKATALGQNEERAREILKESYNENASLDDLMKLGIKVQKETSEEKNQHPSLKVYTPKSGKMIYHN